MTGDRVVKALEKAGFTVARIRGSHHILRHPDGRFTTVPVHRGRDIRPGTLRGILTDAGLTVDEFRALLWGSGRGRHRDRGRLVQPLALRSSLPCAVATF